MEDSDTSMEKSASLMKCPAAVSRAFKSVVASSSASDRPRKIIETINLLNPDESSALEDFFESTKKYRIVTLSVFLRLSLLVEEVNQDPSWQVQKRGSVDSPGRLNSWELILIHLRVIPLYLPTGTTLWAFFEPAKESAKSDPVHATIRYKLNISTDCAPLAVFSETDEGKSSLELEGKVDSVLELEPHFDNFEDYSKSFRGRTITAETRGIKAIEIEHLRNLKDEKLGSNAVEPSTTNANAAASGRQSASADVKGKTKIKDTQKELACQKMIKR